VTGSASLRQGPDQKNRHSQPAQNCQAGDTERSALLHGERLAQVHQAKPTRDDSDKRKRRHQRASHTHRQMGVGSGFGASRAPDAATDRREMTTSAAVEPPTTPRPRRRPTEAATTINKSKGWPQRQDAEIAAAAATTNTPTQRYAPHHRCAQHTWRGIANDDETSQPWAAPTRPVPPRPWTDQPRREQHARTRS